MIGWTMRRLPAGSFAWLALHELRLSVAGRRKSRLAAGAGTTRLMGIIGWAVLVGWVGIGVLIALGLRDVPIKPHPLLLVGLLCGAVVAFTLMTTQALIASQRTLYESGDLDLLFSAPVHPRAVMSAKLVGIVASIALTYAFFLLPLVLPVAFLGHPRLFGVAALLGALALLAACFGLALTLGIAKVAGPRAARTLGQIVAALTGGAIFLVSQLSRGDRTDGQSAITRLFHWLTSHGYGSSGWSAMIGRAGFGDPIAIGLIGGGSLLLFALTVVAMNRLFVASYRAGGMRLSRTRRVRGGVDKHFRPGLFGSVFAKEWLLLLRDPALVFQVVLRLVYLAPLFIAGIRVGSAFAATLAFMSVVIAGQMVGSLAWLTVSAEDSPDLIKVAPVAKDQVDSAKMAAALAMALPFGLILPIAILVVTHSILGAAVTFGMTLLGGWITGLLEVKFGKPSPRTSFRRRGASGGVVRTLLQFALTIVLGGIAASTVFLLTTDLSRISLPNWAGHRAPNASSPSD